MTTAEQPCHFCATSTATLYDIDVLLEVAHTETRSVAVCDSCVHTRLRRRLAVCTIVLAIVWSLVIWRAIYALGLDLTSVWIFANIVPGVVLGLFVTAFFYDGFWASVSTEGKRRAVEGWFYREG